MHTEVGQSEAKLKAAYGKDTFYLPHGIFVDDSDYIYTTDVGSHQVIKWKVNGGKLEQVFALGEKFVPGSDVKHFCKPSGVAVDRKTGMIYVSDGYCNNRVMVFGKDGTFIQQFGEGAQRGREGSLPPLGSFNLPHDISLDEKGGKVFIADRENGRVQIYNQRGDSIKEISYPSLFRDLYSAHYSDGKLTLHYCFGYCILLTYCIFSTWACNDSGFKHCPKLPNRSLRLPRPYLQPTVLLPSL